MLTSHCKDKLAGVVVVIFFKQKKTISLFVNIVPSYDEKRTPSSELLWGNVQNRNRYKESEGAQKIAMFWLIHSWQWLSKVK